MNLPKSIIVLFLFIIGCNNNDDGIALVTREDGSTEIPITSVLQIQGTWKFVKITSNVSVDLNNDSINNFDLFNELDPCILDDQLYMSEGSSFNIRAKDLTCNDFEEINSVVLGGTYGLVLDPRRNFISLLHNSITDYPLNSNGIILCLDIIELSFPDDDKNYIEFLIENGIGFEGANGVIFLMQKVQ
ncbi:DUF5004 domain-containing protein [Aquimarina sp. MMG015]|uniref:DUF5004 domain-containing protein n=1 Tax=Aquimarina sp. MMG015 TaxID=2822689 RepID=UPI001B3A154D|nr:DUF5004 domain-containing protein [Aquimarina sp. MMG015]MBQ4803167.1 DUF5004 domain-containing protein [Aquimarina sp. MMG015]